MTVKVLICESDGTQTIELHILPDDWFEQKEPEEGFETENM